MIHATDLHPLSVRGRYAFALACLEGLCQHFGVTSRFIDRELADHWSVLEVPKGCHWFDQHEFPVTDREFAAAVQDATISDDQFQSLFHAFREARQVFCCNCYAAASDRGSMDAALNIVGILCRWSVSPPELAPFLSATWSGDFELSGWGNPVTKATFGR